jgi:predicted MPP superfamily phosphohydrolase
VRPRGGWRRALAVAAGLCLLAAAVVLVDACRVEPYSVEVTRHEIRARVPRPLTIAHLTDLHTTGLGPREREMLAALERERPDAIVLTGDTNTSGSTFEGMREVLASLDAPLGVWAVRGNHEIWSFAPRARELYESAGVRYLENEAAELAPGVWLVGLDDPFAGRPDPSAFDGVPEGAYRIALFHAPVGFDQVAGRCDLAFAGHTHGGQIRIPLVHPFWLPPACGPYVAGWYEREAARMYVSRGVGTTGPPVRFLCRPEVAVVRLVPEDLQG